MNKTSIQTSSLVQEALLRISDNNHLPPKGSKIAIAMSGGVDSSVTAALLKLLDYEVFGLTGWLMEGSGKCCDGGMLDSARIAEIIGIEHESLDLREYFKSTIINPFVSSYAVGRTPVPCMPCNTEVKWGSLLEYSKTLQASHLASGHYARLNYSQNTYCIGKASDPNKDQSYMLWGLSQEQLSRTVFPLANFIKDEVRALAQELNLINWNKQESQDICFIPNTTKEFLLERLGERKGEIKHMQTGQTLGTHSGTHLFTIGQRKGIGISSTEPIYVIKIDTLNNVVYVGGKQDLYSKSLMAEDVNWQQPPTEASFEALVKIRYNSEPLLAQIIPSTNSFKANFQAEGESVTPGQAAVIYDLNHEFIIGGGWIRDFL